MPRLIKTKQKYTVNCRFKIPRLIYVFFLGGGGARIVDGGSFNRGLMTACIRSADQNTFCIYWFLINPQKAIIN